MPPKKRHVYLQVVFAKVGEINTAKESYEADVLITSRWKEPAIEGKDEKSIDWNSLWNPKLYIDNAASDVAVSAVYSTEKRKHTTFAVETKRFKGVFGETMDLRDFPFDLQDLSIMIKSDTDYKETRLLEYPKEMHRVLKRSFIDEQEFILYKYVECSYPVLGSDFTLAVYEKQLPTIQAKIYVARRPQYFICNIAIYMNVILLLAYASYGADASLKATLNMRLQICFVLILGAIIFMNLVYVQLPKVSYLTYGTVYVFFNLFILSIITSWHGIMTRLPPNGRVSIDFWGCVTIGIVVLVFNVLYWDWMYSWPCAKRREMEKKEEAYLKRYEHMQDKHKEEEPPGKGNMERAEIKAKEDALRRR